MRLFHVSRRVSSIPKVSYTRWSSTGAAYVVCNAHLLSTLCYCSNGGQIIPYIMRTHEGLAKAVKCAQIAIVCFIKMQWISQCVPLRKKQWKSTCAGHAVLFAWSKSSDVFEFNYWWAHIVLSSVKMVCRWLKFSSYLHVPKW